MDRDPNYLLNQAKENRQKYKELKLNDPVRAKHYRNQAEQYLRLYKQQQQNIATQKRIDSLLQRGVPTNEDVREDAANLGIDINQSEENSGENLGEMVDQDNNMPSLEQRETPLNPLATDEEQNIELSAPPPEPITPPVTLPNLETNKTRKNIQRKPRSQRRQRREIRQRKSKTPESQGIEMQDLSNIETTRLLGFSETLKNNTVNTPPITSVNPNMCQNIFMNGSKINKKYFYPSEFPKLTKINPISVSIKRGGKKQKNKRKSRKLIKF